MLFVFPLCDYVTIYLANLEKSWTNLLLETYVVGWGKHTNKRNSYVRAKCSFNKYFQHLP